MWRFCHADKQMANADRGDSAVQRGSSRTLPQLENAPKLGYLSIAGDPGDTQATPVLEGSEPGVRNHR
jgi:hypothetical protein